MAPKPRAGLSERVKGLLDDQNTEVRAAAIRVAGALKLESLRPELARWAQASDTPMPVRSAAILSLADLGSGSAAELKKLAESSDSQIIRRDAIAALASIDLQDAARRAADLLADPKSADDPTPLLRAFVGRAGGADA